MTRAAEEETEDAAEAWLGRGGDLDAESDEAFRAGNEGLGLALADEADEAFSVASHLFCVLDRQRLLPLLRPPDPVGVA